ncbi:DUF2993 domain-containing protein [Gordonia sp. ABSL49_1]|uniref:LmeA family phospholipid-binding protein n=1 Tax=Gordonia sp. ABSL49_1 TaxID=2920941 RepID=UPI001F105069|nr:DUF2993 domain-containing protein [Gordonia sp. ABSL49_1]MCH5644975.1 LmeA family phospholipid-binding protein [Gordonia sp. ABSL49_1]
MSEPDRRGDHGTGSDRRVPGRRYVAIALIVIVVTGLLAVLADVGLAIRTEYQMSRAIAASPRVSFDPEVTLSGFPFLTHVRAGRFDGAVIAARDVTLPGCEGRGGCRGELGATLGLWHIDDAWDITADDVVRTESVSAHTKLDAVTMARYLGIVDLTVSTPAPDGKVGGGGPQDGAPSRQSGVVLTGTVALPPSAGDDPDNPPSASTFDGPKVRVSVSVDLSVQDGRLAIRATDYYTGPERHVDADVPEAMRAAVLDRFTTILPLIPLPWGLTPQWAASLGGDILLHADSGPADLRLDAF